MSSVTLDEGALATLFPFHFRLDAALCIVALSPVLGRLMPDLRAGAAFADHFVMERPVLRPSFAAFSDCHRVMFLLRAKRGLDQEELLLRGQMMFLPATDELLFVGNPRVRELADLKRLDLTMRDFPPDSTLTDYLILIRTQQTALAEAQRLASDLAKARDAAQMASNSKSEFLANMSHELRTPLNAILGFSEMITGQMAGPISDNYQGYAADIHKSGHLLLAIINDVLDMARIEAGYHTLEDEKVLVDEVVRDCIHLLEARAEEREITLGYHSDLPGTHIRADARALKQICLNLLSNAVKFNKWDGDVRVRFTRRGDAHLALIFEDTGLGIPTEDLPRLFRPFQQAGATTTRTFGGTGLGLSITRTLVEMHGGRIELASTLDQGSIFTVLLPVERLV
nr:ATP-binding protein [uncultured Dongia sp.]